MDGWRDILARALNRSQFGAALDQRSGGDDSWEWLISELLEMGHPFVAECREAIPPDRAVEPHLSLVQVYCGCLRLMLEAEQARDEMPEEIPPLLPGYVALYAHVVQVLGAVRATLMLAARGLDVQAFATLRQAMELAARAIVLSGDAELNGIADAMALDSPVAPGAGGSDERRLWRQCFSPDLLFKKLTNLQRDTGMVSDEAARVKAVQDWRRRFRGFSEIVHGGAQMTRWTWSQQVVGRDGTESEGLSQPGDGLAIIVGEVLYLLYDFCGLFPLVIRPTRTLAPATFPDEVRADPEAYHREMTLYAGLCAAQAVVLELWTALYPGDES